MKIIKMLFIGLVIGFGAGMWIGVNIGKGNPIWSNPFAKENLQQKIKERVGESIEKLGGDIKGKIAK